jgi:hypothetical protein
VYARDDHLVGWASMQVKVRHVHLLADSITRQRVRFVIAVVPCLGRETGLRRRLFSDLDPMNRRRTPASICQKIKPFHGSARDRFHDRESMSVSKFRSDGGMSVVATNGWKSVQVIEVIGTTDGGDLSSSIEVWQDKGIELRSPMVRVEFVVDLLPDELYKLMSALVWNQGCFVHMPSRTSSRVMIPSGMMAGCNICKDYDKTSISDMRPSRDTKRTSFAFPLARTASAGVIFSFDNNPNPPFLLSAS